ncbi:hypothetical protein FH972_006041 [Carpinus fangiana]|uniref:Uncharacterized protein n=1 Tax=Carpinus fangiana TaxID=176857 RepID=A0A5N6QU11_9ROSI|nr:hypothetical protein FH972_006041 [Carpinus fangiana]
MSLQRVRDESDKSNSSRSEVLCDWSSGDRAGLAPTVQFGCALVRELWALGLRQVCGPCVGIFGRLEIGEVTGQFRGFVGPGAPAVGCTLAF